VVFHGDDGRESLPHRERRTTMTSDERNDAIIRALSKAYNMELETVMNYIAVSTNLDGVRAKHIKDELAADVPTELGHAQIIANRIKTIGGEVPGSLQLEMDQQFLQTPEDTTDIETVIRGVIEAEEGAIAQYKKVIELASDFDPATEDLAITALADEEEHRREFKGFLKELEAGRLG
jgi:bacterioferritin